MQKKKGFITTSVLWNINFTLSFGHLKISNILFKMQYIDNLENWNLAIIQTVT